MHYEKFADGSMKCIEDAIQFELPKGWQWVRCANIINLYSGQDLTPDRYNEVGDGIPYITGASNLENGKIIINRWTTTPTTHSAVGDLLLIVKGSGVGKMAFNDIEDVHIARQIMALRCSPAILEYYLFVVISSLLQNIISQANGIIPGIRREIILTTLIPVPPLNEQSNIGTAVKKLLFLVKKLEDDKNSLLNSLRLARFKILDLAIRGQLEPQDPDDEPASVLLERIQAEKKELIKQGKIKHDKKESTIFRGEDNSYYEIIDNKTICIDEEIPFDLPASWIWCRLKSLAAPHENSFVDGPFGSNLKTDHYTENREVRIIQLNNIGEFTWKNSGVKYTTYRHAELLERCKSYPGDIVIAKMMPAGRTIIIPDIEDAYVISSDCVRLQLPEYIDNEYIMFMINSPTINAYILKYVQGIGRTRTSLGKLKELLIPLPPYNQQVHISMFFKKVFNYFDVI